MKEAQELKEPTELYFAQPLEVTFNLFFIHSDFYYYHYKKG
jgi:hypothetical protein